MKLQIESDVYDKLMLMIQGIKAQEEYSIKPQTIVEAFFQETLDMLIEQIELL